MPLIETKGAASAQGFGEFAKTTAAVYIEDVFSTWLTTGAGSAITVVNGIDLAGKGGLVWNKTRNTTGSNTLFDTARGVNNALISDSTNAQLTSSNWLPAFNSDGFTIGTTNNLTTSSTTGVSWTFRKAPKFFDVVTYTGNGTTQNISHSLGSTPGCIIAKRTNTTGSWRVFHRSVSTQYGNLNSTAAFQTASAENVWGNNSTTVAPTSTQFTVGNDSSLNASGSTYVAYLFAHDAGGFGLTGTDNVISCGSYTGTGSTLSVTLGYEPQWVMIKRTDTTADWQVIDNMRGWIADGVCQRLVPNTSAAEAGPTGSTFLFPTATGFGSAGSSAIVNASGGTYIYIAIRRGPMKTPTSGTSVFNPTLQSASTTPQTKDYGITTDSVWGIARNGAGYEFSFWTRLQGANRLLRPQSTAAELASATDALIGFDAQTGVRLGADSGSWIQASVNWVHYPFRRAPGFFDVVCYTGSSSNLTVNHNLGVVPELMIVKNRVNTGGTIWAVYAGNKDAYLRLNTTNASSTTSPSPWNDTAPTASVFTLSNQWATNLSGEACVAYLFASCPGVSKVGSYTGTGALQTINCGFTGGARFVLIKRTDSTGDWFTYDSARGITSGNDPYSLLNSTAAEVTGTNYVDTTSVGFQVTAAAPAGLNANGGSYIFLAIA